MVYSLSFSSFGIVVSSSNIVEITFLQHNKKKRQDARNRETRETERERKNKRFLCNDLKSSYS